MIRKKEFFNKYLVVALIIGAFALGMSLQNSFSKNIVSVSVKDGRINLALNTILPTPTQPQIDLAKLQEDVLPEKGYIFKIRWGDLGKKMIEDGVIDKRKLAQAVVGQDNLPEEMEKYLDGTSQNQIEISSQNAQFWVDLLWGLGLANKNELLEKGPMVEGNQTANFASTGGFTIGVKKPMDIYDNYSYIKLTPEQQTKVTEISSNIFRPCCGNSAAFPDCNHGMAALALVELMVSQNFNDQEIYQTVLAFNSYWFPQTYLDISYHFAKNGRDFNSVLAKDILSKTFSSSSGYQALKRQIGTVAWPALRGGNSCGA